MRLKQCSRCQRIIRTLIKKSKFICPDCYRGRRLTVKQVEHILNKELRHQSVSPKEYGVSKKVILNICEGKSYARLYEKITGQKSSIDPRINSIYYI